MTTVTPARRREAARLRPGAGRRRGRLPQPDALERRAGGRLRGRAAADAESARDRAAARLAPRRRGRAAPHRAGARGGGARAARAHAVRRRGARSSSRQHTSTIVFGEGERDPESRLRPHRRSRCSTRSSRPTLSDDELERLRIEAATPRFGREIDDRVLPAEAGLDARADLVHQGLLPGPGARRAAAPPGEGEPQAAGARGGRRPAGSPRRRSPTRARRSAASRARCRASPSPTSASRCRTTPRSTSTGVLPGYTDPSSRP